MAGKTIAMSIFKQIIRLRMQGISLKGVSKSIGVSRNTAKKYLRLLEVKGFSFEEYLQMDDESLSRLLQDSETIDSERLQKLESLFPHFENELKRTGVTRWILWGEYKNQHPDGYNYSRFCDYYKSWTDSQKATMHFEHKPGMEVYVDYSGKKMPIVDRFTGEIIEAEIFISVLGYSQYAYVEAIKSQTTEDAIWANENAFHFFGGVPMVMIPDNAKCMVTKADRYEPQINSRFLDFANHYGVAVMPARSRKPRDKAIVESTVNTIYSRIFAPLRNEVFYSLEELNKAIREQLQHHNTTAFRQRPGSRQSVFEQEEKNLLKPLAAERYELKTYKEVTVQKNGYVVLSEDKHYYSVPYRFIGKRVKLIYTGRFVSVYYNKERIAYHTRGVKKYGYTTVKEHMSSSHQFVSEWNPEKFIGWAAGIDPIVEAYITRILDVAQYPEQGYKSCVGILSLSKKAGRERLIKAVERATYFGVYNYSTIQKILSSGMDSLPHEENDMEQQKLPSHENIRGPQLYQ